MVLWYFRLHYSGIIITILLSEQSSTGQWEAYLWCSEEQHTQSCCQKCFIYCLSSGQKISSLLILKWDFNTNVIKANVKTGFATRNTLQLCLYLLLIPILTSVNSPLSGNCQKQFDFRWQPCLARTSSEVALSPSSSPAAALLVFVHRRNRWDI